MYRNQGHVTCQQLLAAAPMLMLAACLHGKATSAALHVNRTQAESSVRIPQELLGAVSKLGRQMWSLHSESGRRGRSNGHPRSAKRIARYSQESPLERAYERRGAQDTARTLPPTGPARVPMSSQHGALQDWVGCRDC